MASSPSAESAGRAWSEPLGLRAKGALIAEIFAVYVRARLVMRTNKLREATDRMRSTPSGRTVAVPAAQHRDAAVHLASAVTRVLRRLPTDSRCLARSLVLTSLLSRRGIPSVLVVAARPKPTFTAHAWVELDGRPLLPPADAGMKRLTEA